MIFDDGARAELTGEARAKRRGLENDMKGHLAALDETGAADNAVAARARAELPEIEYAAFQQNQAGARERHATRAEYAFMTEAEIEADIAQQAPGGGPRDTDERAAGHVIRRATADEVLAARAEDPAGWALRDPTVKQSIEDAEAALEAAEPGTPGMTVAERAYRRALVGRDRMQRDMGIEEPRLLSEVERERIAVDLAGKTPADRRGMLTVLWKRHGDNYGRLVEELGGEVDADTLLLAQFAMHPRFAELLAKGMEKARANGPARPEGASVASLPFIGAEETDAITGKANPPLKFDYRSLGTRYEDQQVFQLPNGSYVIYDGEALVPAVLEQGDSPKLALAPDANPHAEEAAEAAAEEGQAGGTPGRRPDYPVTGENGVSYVPTDIMGRDADPDPAAGVQKEIDALSAKIVRERQALGRAAGATPAHRAQIKARDAEIKKDEDRLKELEAERDRVRADHEAEFGDRARQQGWPVPLREDGTVDEDVLREEFGIEVDDGTFFIWDGESRYFHEARRLDEPDEQGRYFAPLPDVEPLDSFGEEGVTRSADEIEAEARALAEQVGRGDDEADAVAKAAERVELLQRQIDANPRGKSGAFDHLAEEFDEAVEDLLEKTDEFNKAIAVEAVGAEGMPERMDNPARLENAANTGIKAGAEVFASIPIFIAVSNAKVTQNVNIFLDELESGTPLNELLVNPPKPMTLHEYLTVLAYNAATLEEKEDIRQRFADTDPRNSELHKFGAKIMDYLDEKLETNPKYADEFFASVLPAAIGDTAAKGLTLAGLTALGVPTPVAAAMIGAANESSKLFREALDEGKPIDEAYREFGFGALMGLTEGLPLAELLGRADKASGGTIGELLKDAAIKGTEEAIKEVIKKSRDILYDKGIADNQELAAVFTVEAVKEFGIGLLGAK